MHKNVTKLRAFTIMELLVVMGVSGLIVTAGFVLLTQFTSFFETTTNHQEKVADLQQFYHQLNKDVLMAKKLKQEGAKLLCELDDYQIHYEFSSAVISREFMGKTEVLDVENLLYEMIPIANFNDEGIIVNLHLQFGKDSEVYNWKIQKEYGAAVHLNTRNNLGD